ncbi:protein FAR-RED ELONGATED HYPOCOTYL 3-like [Impatiens glandulifera]|uniref:protein FAR-RED ELONGATED HYPOCOTYL 3-like n=1 Tax=Impatiens glandulifera TaxID=253017 RepID=UPI001FB157F1|nr:protein FAR-RED ELONGATED HYPOCOTYL 3-like [Impatiens glandulifera]
MNRLIQSAPVIEIPNVGMIFPSKTEIRLYYKAYALGTGFSGKNLLYLRPSTKTNCKAKINVAVRNDGEVVITSVFLEHNHAMSPGKSRHLRSHKVLDPDVKRKLELNDEAGITLAKKNFISESRKSSLGNGDAEALSQYFTLMQSKSPNFYYVYDLNEDSRIRNVFGADGRCRAAYQCFSDVITFDITYLTNRYDMTFAPFVGVNHHGQFILLGCGLLSSEDSSSFIWLFNACMVDMHAWMCSEGNNN